MNQCMRGSKMLASVWAAFVATAIFVPARSSMGDDASFFLPEPYRTGAAYDYRFVLRDESCVIGREMLSFDLDALVRKIVAEALSSSLTAAAASEPPVVEPAAAVDPHDHFGETWSSSADHGLKVVNGSVTGKALYGVAAAETGAGSGVYGQTASPDGRGVYGYASSSTGDARGLYGWSASDAGKAAFGWASSSTGTTYGGYFQVESTSGTGFFGYAPATSGSTKGVEGRASSTSGKGVMGWATAGSGNAHGVYGVTNSADGYGGYFTGGKGLFATGFRMPTSAADGRVLTCDATGVGTWQAIGASSHGHFGQTWTGSADEGLKVVNSSSTGKAVYGYASSSTGDARGLYGWSASDAGKAVFGWASSATGTTYGGYFQVESTSGTGFFGYAPAASGSTKGVEGRANSTSGKGVMGWATASSGNAHGVYGVTNSVDGYGGYFSGGKGVFTTGFRMPTGASNGRVLTCDATGVGTWQAAGAGAGWSLTGNSGTTAGTNFVGTTDSAALEFKVNSARALRLEPHATSPNILGGSSANAVASGCYGAAISGGGGASGTENRIYDSYGCIGGGLNNTCGDDDGNTTTAAYATVGGGWSNQALAIYAVIGGGVQNAVAARSATVAGGDANEANGEYATVPGGRSNSADGNYSFAAGRRAYASNAGSFAWADSTDADYEVAADNRFGARASGGFYFHTNAGATSGAYLAAGSGSWSSLSDRNRKTGFASVNAKDVLARVADMPISTWSYNSEDPSIRHMGPMAQDMHAAFGLGDSDKSICTIDADGVALAAIQGLHQMVKEKDAEIADLKARLARLEAAINTLTDK